MRGPDGTPLAGATVVVDRDGFGAGPGPETSDATGRFEVLGLEPGGYRLIVSHPEHAPAVVFDLELTAHSEIPVDVALEPGSRIVGRLLSRDRPVAGQVAVAQVGGREAPREISDRLRAEAGSDGRFSLERAPRGELELVVRAPGHAAKRVDAAPDGRRLDLGDIPLDTGLAIRGRVTDVSGKPVPDALIQVWSPRDRVDIPFERSEADGSYVAAGLEPDRYEVMVRASGYGEKRRSAVAGAADIDFVLDPAGAILGQVVDEAARPVEAFAVDAHGARTGARAPRAVQEVSDADGRFVLEDVAASTYVVTVSAPDRAAAVVPSVTVTAGGRTDLGRVRLGTGGTVRGTVVDGAGGGIAGATVAIQGPGSRRWSPFEPGSVTAADGSFEVKGAPMGRVEAVATHPSFAPGSASAIHVDPAKGPAEAHIVLTRGGRVQGSLRKRDGSGVPGALIEVGPVTADGPRFLGGIAPVGTAADGSFSVEHVPPGRAQVVVLTGSAGRFESSQSQEIHVREGETTFVDLVSRDVLVWGQVTRGGTPAAGLRLDVRLDQPFAMMVGLSSGVPAAPQVGPQRMTAAVREDGGYEMLVDAPGRATIQAASPDGRLRLPDRVAEIPDADSHRLDLVYTGAPVGGIVVDADTDRALPDSWVSASSRDGADGRRPVRATTGADGRFAFELEPGEYRVAASRGEGGYGGAEADVSVGAGGAPDLRLALPKGSAIVGRVVDTTGRGLGGIRVGAFDDGGAPAGFARSLPDGSFEVAGLRPEPHNLLAEGQTGGFAVAGDARPGDAEGVRLTLRPGGRIRLQVEGPDGQPVQGAVARVVLVTGLAVRGPGGATDAGGVLDFAAPAGPVEVQVKKDDLEAQVALTVGPDARVPAEVRLERRPDAAP